MMVFPVDSELCGCIYRLSNCRDYNCKPCCKFCEHCLQNIKINLYKKHVVKCGKAKEAEKEGKKEKPLIVRFFLELFKLLGLA